MKLALPFEVLFILYRLQQAGWQAFLVGGAVRDLLIQSVKGDNGQAALIDYDFTTNAQPVEIQKLFPENFYENVYGTVGVAHEHLWRLLQKQHLQLPSANLTEMYRQEISKKRRQTLIDLSNASKLHSSLSAPEEKKSDESNPKPFEITTFRADGTYDDHRRPTSVAWGKTVEDDLQRRDFTVNALALKVPQSVLENFFNQAVFPPMVELEPKQYELIDPHGGVQDLSKRLIRAVGDPNLRFKEDALRLLRAVRFAVHLEMDIEPTTLKAVTDHSALIEHVSWERIQDEFFKILISPLPKRGIELMDQTGLLNHVLPELLEAKRVEQGGHHNTDVWVHTLDSLAACPSSDPIVRFATLLHDIGKPRTQKTIDGKITFYNHEIVGSRMAAKIAQRFRLSKKDTDRLFTLVRHHMFYYQPQNTDAAIRRFMRKVGLENIDDILDLREGDRLGSGARKTSWRLEEMKQRMVEQLNQPMSVHDLAIDGHDLIKELKMKPGKQMGEVLNQLFEKVLENPELNDKTQLLAEAKKLL